MPRFSTVSGGTDCKITAERSLLCLENMNCSPWMVRAYLGGAKQVRIAWGQSVKPFV